ncbi:hypothetical protein ACROYT_G043918 [Oculina patagonica]
MSHNRGNCSAYGATCLKCNGRNHYARCCLKPKDGTEERRVRHVQIELSEDKEPMEGLYIEEIQDSTRRNIQSDLLVNYVPVTFKLDTGAEYTVGKCFLDTKVNESKGTTPLEYYVLRNDVKPLLGLESYLELELDEVQAKPSLLDEFQDVFEGLGCVEGEYNIKLKANSLPTIQPQRNVPLRLLDKLKVTLNDLERNDIIAKVEELVEWVRNLVIVEKPNNSLRLCLDPPDLNEAIEREDFKPPSF